MAIEVKMPHLGDGIESGDVLELLVKEGDVIEKDQGILEIETGKATLQVPSPVGGKVVRIHVQPGQTVPVGGLLLTLEPVGTPSATTVPPPAATPQARPAAPPPAAPPPAPPPTVAQVPVAKAVATEPSSASASRPSPAPASPPPPVSPSPASPRPTAPLATATQAPPSRHNGGVVPAGPAVRRFAREVGVDLTRVKGTGPGGRITREDVLAVVRQQSQAAAQAAEPTLRDAWGPIRVERMSKIRRTIAEKMHQSWTTCPRVTNFDDADVTELERLRQASKEDYAKKGIKLTSLPFVVKAVASALRQHPALNASVDMEQGQIIYKEYVNIGIAVDTERGLVVPVLRRADELSIPELARALAELSERVRQGQFTPEDLQGSTFSISNLGAIGGTYSTPIINIPEVAILLVGRTRKMPVVVNDQVAIRLMMPLSLSYDHRLVDGATAARFLNDVIGYLEAPSRLLLAP
jgi:pyruvate dehydrogenase E2 component (dihydrolipoamide acetyltransferase)